MNKLMIGSIAALGASVIAVNPIAPNTAMLDLQHRAVQLVANATDSPATVYGELFTNTITNINALGTAIAAHPLPILSTIAANQVGYVAKVGTAFNAAGIALQNWWEVGTRESAPGKTLLANVQAALKAGDFNTAYDNFNKLTLFGIQNTILPILTGTLLTSGTNLGIPQQMAQNFANAIGAVLNTGTIAYGAFQSVFAPVSGAAFEASRAVQAFTKALSTGDVAGAVTALVNTPGIVANAFLNGFDYDSTDARAPWSGFLSPTGTGTRPASGGPLQQFLITIPTKIAAAIANTRPPVAASNVAALPSAVPAEAGTVRTFDLKVGDDAADSASAVASGAKTAVANKTAVATTGTTTTTTDESTEADTDGATAPAKPAVTKATVGAKSFADRLDGAVKKIGGGAKKATSTSSDDSSASAGAKSSDSSAKSPSKKTSGKHAN